MGIYWEKPPEKVVVKSVAGVVPRIGKTEYVPSASELLSRVREKVVTGLLVRFTITRTASLLLMRRML